MSRRGEGQFVAVEVNLRNDPKVLGFARRLRISRDEAVGKLAAWREFVLTKGTGAGVVKGYTREEIASFLDWPKRPEVMVDALKHGGFLAVKRGAFAYPFWTETATGYYAQKRATDRDRQARRRAEEGGTANGHSKEAPRSVHGQSADAPYGSGQEVSKDVRGQPPGGPPGGAPDAASRLGWFEDNYPKGMVEKEKCAALLAALSPDEWDHLQWAVRKKSASIWWRERGRAPKPERWLEQLEWKREKRPKRTSKPAPDPQAEEQRLEAEREAAAKAENDRKFWKKRDAIRARLKAEGVPSHELQERIDAELAKELPS